MMFVQEIKTKPINTFSTRPDVFCDSCGLMLIYSWMVDTTSARPLVLVHPLNDACPHEGRVFKAQHIQLEEICAPATIEIQEKT